MAILATTAMALSAGIQTSSAQDISAAKKPAVVSAYNWSGFYIGGYVGGAWGNTDVTRIDNGLGFSSTPNGVSLGGILGYNYPIGMGIIGLEGDAGWLSASGTSSGAAGGSSYNQNVKVDFEGRIRARLGYAMDRTLLFAAGGVSFGHQKIALELIPSTGVNSLSNNHTGWNLGGGLDYAFINNLVGRIEYIYDKFNTKTYAFSSNPIGAFADRTANNNTSTVRAALIFKFGGK
jgi:outer membrane immunogenic protein